MIKFDNDLRQVDGFLRVLRFPSCQGSEPTEKFCSPPVFSGIRVTRSVVLCVCIVDRCLSFCTFPFDHCVVCSSSINGF